MHHFYLAGLLGLSAVPDSVALSFLSLQPRDVQSSCNEFKERFPSNAFFTDDVTYTSIDEDLFSALSWLGPACIVSPVPAEDMSSAVKTLADSKTPFAGGGSFATFTAVHLKTMFLPAVAVGEMTYNGSVADDLLDSIYDFAIYGSEDGKAGIEPRVRWIPQRGSPTYHGILFYNGDDASPHALVNFTDKASLQPVSSSSRVRHSMYNWAQEADSDRELLHGLRARFNVVTIRANRQALGILHDTFLEMMADGLEGVAGIVGSLAFVPITAEYLRASTINGGDPMAVDASQAPYILAEETILWSNSTDDDRISDFLDAFNANVTTQLSALDGVQSSFLYLNYADEDQAVFEGYRRRMWPE